MASITKSTQCRHQISKCTARTSYCPKLAESLWDQMPTNLSSQSSIPQTQRASRSKQIERRTYWPSKPKISVLFSRSNKIQARFLATSISLALIKSNRIYQKVMRCHSWHLMGGQVPLVPWRVRKMKTLEALDPGSSLIQDLSTALSFMATIHTLINMKSMFKPD